MQLKCCQPNKPKFKFMDTLSSCISTLALTLVQCLGQQLYHFT